MACQWEDGCDSRGVLWGNGTPLVGTYAIWVGGMSVGYIHVAQEWAGSMGSAVPNGGAGVFGFQEVSLFRLHLEVQGESFDHSTLEMILKGMFVKRITQKQEQKFIRTTDGCPLECMRCKPNDNHLFFCQ